MNSCIIEGKAIFSGESQNKMTRKRTSENDLVVSAGAASTPSRRKSAVRARAKHTPPSGDMSVETSEETPSTSADDSRNAPSHEEIAQLAYRYWEARGRQDGSSDEDWLRAERELRVRTMTV